MTAVTFSDILGFGLGFGVVFLALAWRSWYWPWGCSLVKTDYIGYSQYLVAESNSAELTIKPSKYEILLVSRRKTAENNFCGLAASSLVHWANLWGRPQHWKGACVTADSTKPPQVLLQLTWPSCDYVCRFVLMLFADIAATDSWQRQITRIDSLPLLSATVVVVIKESYA